MKRLKSPFARNLVLAVFAVLVAVGGSAALVNGHQLFGGAPAAVKGAATTATTSSARTLQATRATRGPTTPSTATTMPPPGAPTRSAGSDGSGQRATGLHVNNVSVSVDRASFSGVCPNQVPFVFTLTFLGRHASRRWTGGLPMAQTAKVCKASMNTSISDRRTQPRP